MRQALYAALGPAGLNVLAPTTSFGDFRDIAYTSTSDANGSSRIQFNLHLHKASTLVTEPVDFEAGLPALSLHLDGGIVLNAGYDFDLSFGVDRNLGFYADTSKANELTFDFSAGIAAGTTLTGMLGFLKLSATDDTSSPISHSTFDGQFKVDLTGPHTGLADPLLDKIALTDIQNVLADVSVLKGSLAANANINLKLLAGFDNADLPRIKSDLHVVWGFLPGAPDLTGGIPKITFNNVQLSLGDFYGHFAGPILGFMQDVLGPIKPIIDLLDARLPLISDLAGKKMTLVDLATVFGDVEGAVDVVKALGGIADIVTSLPTGTSSDLYVDLGSFDLGAANVKTLADLKAVKPNIIEIKNPLAGLVGQAKAFFDKSDKPGDADGIKLSWPIIDHPETAFRLLLNQDVNLFNLDLPKIKLKFNPSISFPLPIPIPTTISFGGLVQVTGKLAFGFDTHGLQVYQRTHNEADIADGFYLSNRSNADGTGDTVPILTFTGALTGSLDVTVGVASVGVGAKVGLTLSTYLNDPNNDGRVHGDELFGDIDDGLACAIRITGEIFAEADIHAEVLGQKIEYTFAHVTLYALSVLPEECQGDRFESNNSVITAADIGVGPGQHIEYVSIDRPGDADWYRVTLLKPDSLVVKLHSDASFGNVDFEITDAEGAILGQAATGNDDEIVTLADLPAGSYYIHAYGQTNVYTFSVEPGPGSSTRVIYVDGVDETANGKTDVFFPDADHFHRTNRSFYTLRLGNDANDGLSADHPKSTLQSVYNSLTLTPNDLIVLDTALYPDDLLAPAAQAGVTIVGAPFFDESAGAVVRAGNGWTLNSSGNRVRNIRFGPPAVKSPPFPGQLSTALTINGNDDLLEKNTFFAFGAYVSYLYAVGDSGDRNTIQDNTVTGTDGIRLDAGSDHALVQRNSLTVTVVGIVVNGTNADVKSNTIDTREIPSPDSPAFSTGIAIGGDFNTVESNSLETTEGIDLNAGKRNIITSNTMIKPLSSLYTSNGILVGVDQPLADRSTIDSNDASKFSNGLKMTGNGANVYGNHFHHGGDGAFISADDAILGTADPDAQPVNEFDHNSTGIEVALNAANAVVRFNKVHDNGVGISLLDAASTTFGNDVYANGTGVFGLGVIGPSDWTHPNTIHDNTTGIQMSGSGGGVRFNRIFANATGIEAATGANVNHNVIYRNTLTGVHVKAGVGSSLANNTIYLTSGNGVLVDTASRNVAIRNNIVWSDGDAYDINVTTDSQVGLDSDYNNLFATNGGKVVWFEKPFIDLYDWQVEGDLDLHSIGYIAPLPDLDNPRFKNLAANDYHLNAGSTSIDSGDPVSAFGLEPQNNGNRINQGAYGNTDQATASSSAYIRITYPNYYLDWVATRARNIVWTTYNITGNVKLELFLEGGGKVADIGFAAASAGTFLWSPQASGIAPDAAKRYRIHITSVDQPSVGVVAREFFNVPQASANYYINDGSTVGDEFTTAVGDNRNNGRSPDRPKADVLPILRNYALTANDVVHVDTGNYIDVRNLSINFNTTANPNPGTELGDDQGFTIVGPTDQAKVASLDRANPFLYATHVDVINANFMVLQRLTLLGGGAGVLVRNNSASFHADHLVVANTGGDGVRLDSTAVTATLDTLVVHDNAGNGIVVASVIPSLSNSSVYDNGADGIDLTNAGGIVVQRNTVHDNKGFGIYVVNPTFGSTALIGSLDLPAGLGNIVYHNDRNGIFTSSAVGATLGVVVAGNTVHDHKNLDQYAGIHVSSGDRATLNVVYDNSRGIEAFNSSSVDNNRVYDNTHVGIYAQNDVAVTGNTVYGNDIGVQALLMRGLISGVPQIANNAVYNNTHTGLLIQTAINTLPSGAIPSGHLQVFNNTVYQPGGVAVRVEGNSRDIELRNNIIDAPGSTAISVADDSQFHFTSDSNILYAPGGAIGDWQGRHPTTLLAWQNTAFTDYSSLAIDPLLVAPGSGDLHERSTAGSFHGGSLAPILGGSGLPVANPGSLTADAAQSPAIDRGDFAVPFVPGTETAPNGNAVNLGAYGNTAQASRSPSQYVLVTSPQAAAVWPMGETFSILWHSQDVAGNVVIELLHAGSASVVRTIAPAAANTGRYDWSLPADLAPDNDYVVRVTRSDAAGAGSSAAFAIAPVTHTFYVNDGSVEAGSLTTAAGADGNDGLTPATPKPSIQAVLAAYHLGAGDVVRVDRGSYFLTTNVTVGADDAGVRIEGIHAADPADGAVLVRGNNTPNGYVAEVLHASGVTLDHLSMTGARVGVFADSFGSVGYATHLTVSNSRIFDNLTRGIDLTSNNDFAAITGNTLSGDRSLIVQGVPIHAQGTAIAANANNLLISGNTLTQSTPIFSDVDFGIASGGLRNVISGNNVSGYLYGIDYAVSNIATGLAADVSTISGNTVHDDTNAGIIVTSSSSNSNQLVPRVVVSGNTVFGHNVSPGGFTLTAGIYGGDQVSGNVVYDNSNGIQGGGLVSGNRVFGNSVAGIVDAALAKGNQAYSNGIGIVSAYKVENNLVYANTVAGIEVHGGNAQNHTRVLNNTVYQPTGDGVRVDTNASGIDIRNNIIQVGAGVALTVDASSQSGFSSDYNLIHSTGSGTVAKWGAQAFADLVTYSTTLGFDAHSFDADPDFVNPPGVDFALGYDIAAKVDHGQDDNFHLSPPTGSGEFSEPQSPGIDAGDPLSYFLSEPQPNGGRINLGFEGNTPQATPSASPAVVVLAPHGGEQIQEGSPFTIQWTSLGIASQAPVSFINVGGPTVGQYLFGNYQTLPTNQASILGSTNFSQTTNQPVDTSGVTNPAPMAVYQSMAFANSATGNRISFSLPVPDGAYSIRLHFADPFFDQAGFRTFDIKLQNATVKSNYDIVADAGAPLKAATQTFSVNAAGGQGIQLDLVGTSPLNPDLGPLISGIELVSINPAGAASAKFDLAVSVDNGTTYAPITAGIVADRFGAGSFLWTAGPQSNGTNALVKVTSEDQPTVSGASPQAFQIVPGGHNFYVNDNSLTGDEYTTAVGNDANSGKAPSAPMATLSALLASYKPHAGDTVFVDSGTYNLLQNVTLTADYAGVTIVGPTGAGHQALFDRGAGAFGTYGFDLQTGASNITLDHLSITGAYVGVHFVTGPFGGSAIDHVSITNSTIFDNNFIGIDLPYGNTNTLISGNTIYGDLSDFSTFQRTGISAAAPSTTISGNTLYSLNAVDFQADYGMTVSGDGSLVTGNTVHDAGRFGIYATNAVTVSNNTAYNFIRSDNLGTGISVSYGAAAVGNTVHDSNLGIDAHEPKTSVTGNRVYNNTRLGIFTNGNPVVRGNTVYSNPIGIQLANFNGGGFQGDVSGNLVYANTTEAILVESSAFDTVANRSRVWGNTIYQPVGDGIVVDQSTNTADLRNNIIQVGAGSALKVAFDSAAGLFSDYNVYFATGAGRIATWAGVAVTTLDDAFYNLGIDGNSLFADPRFVDPDGADGGLGFVGGADKGLDDNFHLQADSPAIDAGDPSSAYVNEPGPNGRRVNIGYDGNTAFAATSTARLVQVLTPVGREKFSLGQAVPIQWRSTGLTLQSPVLLVDAGGGDGSGWSADRYLTSGSAAAAYTTPVDVSGVVDPAPAAVYRSFDAATNGVGNKLSYKFAVPDGSYTLRLHFFEPYNSNVGSRVFDIVAQGAVAVADYDITGDAGTFAKATQQTIAAVAAGGAGLTLDLVNKTYTGAVLAGIEILSANAGGVAAPTFSVQLSTDNGANWSVLAAAVGVDHLGNGSFNWTAGPVSNQDLVRVVANAAGSPQGQSKQAFLVANAGHDYYVNDNATAGDSLTTVVGNNANTGKSPDSPMASLLGLFAAYKPHAGDTVHVDNGSYTLLRNLRLAADVNGVAIQGPAAGVGEAMLSRGGLPASRQLQNGGIYDIEFTGAANVTLDRLALTGADVGVYSANIFNPFAVTSAGLTISNSRLFNNGAAGAILDSTSSATTLINNIVSGNPAGNASSTLQGIGIQARGNDTHIVNNTVANTGFIGIDVGGQRAIVSGNAVSNTQQGIVDNSGSPNSTVVNTISNNVVHDTTSTGLRGGLYTLVTGNTVYNVAGNGVAAIQVVGQATNNTVYNSYDGIVSNGQTALIDHNRVFHNAHAGIVVSNRESVIGNRIYGNAIGVMVSGTSSSRRWSGRIEDNLIYANANQGILVGGGDSFNQVHVSSNTIYQPVGDAIRVDGGFGNIDIRSNIVQVNAGYGLYVAANTQTGLTSDYNEFFKGPAPNAFVGYWNDATQADFAAWKAASGKDVHSLFADPAFIDINGADNIFAYDTTQNLDGGSDDNFQLLAGSPAIDRGYAWGLPAADLLGAGRVDDPGTTNAGAPDYAVSTLGSSLFDPAGGTQLNLFSSYNSYTLPFAFPFYGASYTSVYVSVTGVLQFGGVDGPNDTNNTAAKFLTNIRVTPLWDNLSALTNVFIDATVADQVRFRWSGTNNGNGQPVNFAVVLFADGQIRFDYGAGNTGLTPTAGVSRGDGSTFLLAPTNNQATLTNANSVLFSFTPGFADIGAYEFRGSSADTTLPTITGSTPVGVHASGSVPAPLTQIVLTTSEPLNPTDANAPALYELRFAGPNGTLGNADDILYTLTPQYTLDATSLTLNLPAVALPAGLYRLTVFSDATRSLHDTSGLPLAGAGGNVAAPYVRQFTLGAAANVAPGVSLDAPAATPEGTTFALAGTFTDPDAGQTFTATVNFGDGSGDQPLTLKPDKSFNLAHDYAIHGLYTVTVTVNDSAGGSTPLSAVASITQVNPTAAFTNAGAVTEGTAGSVSFNSPFHPLASVVAAGFKFSYDFDDNGTFELAGSSSATVAVPASYLTGVASRVVHGRITDVNGGFSDYTTTIAVNPAVPQAPVADNDLLSVNENSSIKFSVLDNDSHGLGVTFNLATVVVGTAQTHGLLVYDAGVGKFLYKPAQNFSGQDSFTYTVKDSLGQVSNLATVTLQVLNVPSLAVASSTVNAAKDQAGKDQRSNVETVDVQFGRDTNLPALITDSTVTQAVQLWQVGIPAPVQVALVPARFHYDTGSRTLSLDLTLGGLGGTDRRTILGDGRYELRLDTNLITADDGSTNLIDTDATIDGIHRIAFHRLLGDYDGDGSVTIGDRPIFQARLGSKLGTPGYDAAFDLNNDGLVNIADYLLWTKQLNHSI
ncbi:MAG: right-handed parallel beta-helix repeat-containing protein [Planctomycetota bacterium]|nr:right-handed parallel beta-helix repeat-containing protein [Planctomycetota bacterium]